MKFARIVTVANGQQVLMSPQFTREGEPGIAFVAINWGIMDKTDESNALGMRLTTISVIDVLAMFLEAGNAEVVEDSLSYASAMVQRVPEGIVQEIYDAQEELYSKLVSH